MQRSVDLALPNRVNRISGDRANKVLISSYSDIDPGTWYLLDMKTHELNALRRVRLAIEPEQMQRMETLTYPSFDGLKIPAYLTRPKDKAGPAPTVILIHGGPHARDHWGWDQDVQFLAGRGYVVFQPQFCGSTGFGKKHEVAGYRQWGLGMQDDITAGVEYLIKQGISDPSRICIYGASYGGYAAMWGLVKTPDLYRCGVSFAGVADIGHMLTDWSDLNFYRVGHEIRKLRIGYGEVGKDQFDAVSPLKHAAKIKAPILLMHGEEDWRVPVSHAYKMRAALKEAKKTVDWLMFDDAGHGLSDVGQAGAATVAVVQAACGD